MKKIVRLTESDITRIVKRVIKENEDMGNPMKCIKTYIDFAFTNRKNGGDLLYWNDDVIPEKNDTAAYERFIKYLKDVMDIPLYVDEECEGVTFDDVAPFIRELYLKKITESNLDDKENNGRFEKLINKYANEISQRGYSDVYDWMSRIFDEIEWDISDEYDDTDDIISELKDEYDEYLMGMWNK
jgi:hypothetical protein